jgi:hypothetical protein
MYARCSGCGHHHIQKWDGKYLPCQGLIEDEATGGTSRCLCHHHTTTAALPAAA